MIRPTVLLSAAATFAALALPAAAGAAPTALDRDRDRMPDRWETAHGLKVKVNDSSRDKDRDGLKNLAEYKSGLDPRDADSDNDGLEDDDEQAGKVLSFANGVLTLKTFDGETFTGRVTDATEIECEDEEKTASIRSADDDDEADEDEDGDEAEDEGKSDRDKKVSGQVVRTGVAPNATAAANRRVDVKVEEEDEDEIEESADCGVEVLEVGAEIEEARLSVKGTSRVWTELELG